LKPNCPGMIIGRSGTRVLFFYADRKSKMVSRMIRRKRRRERNVIIPGPRVYRDRSNSLETTTDNELFERYQNI
jgi:hypothetical protein